MEPPTSATEPNFKKKIFINFLSFVGYYKIPDIADKSHVRQVIRNK